MRPGSAIGDIVIIAGPPGTGKTSLARGLAAGFTAGVHLEADLFFHFIVSGYIAPWRPESDSQNHVVNTVVARAASVYARGGYTVIIDGINGPWFLEHLFFDLEADAVHYLIVRCDRDLAVERIHQRVDHAYATDRYGGDIDDAAVRLMHDKFVAAENLPFEVLDTSALSADQTLQECRALLAAGRLRIDRQTVELLDT